MISDLRELYQELILDHSRRPRNLGRIANSTATADGHNPLCGDVVKLSLRVENGVVADIAFEGQGCAISTASASMMTIAVKGKPIEDAEALFQRFRRLVTQGEDPEVEELGDLAVLAGVHEHPVRIKCATLAWHTLQAAMEGRDKASTE